MNFRPNIDLREIVQLFQYFQMNVLKTVTAFCFVFIVGMESRIQSNTAEFVNWLVAGTTFIVFILFIILILILGILLLIFTTATECEDGFLVITEAPVTLLLATQETLYNDKLQPTLFYSSHSYKKNPPRNSSMSRMFS